MKHHIYIITILLAVFSKANAQDITTLEEEIKVEKDSLRKMQLRLEVADLILWEGQEIQKAKNYIDEVIKFCKTGDCKEEQNLYANILLAEYEINIGNYNNADSLMTPFIIQDDFPSKKIKARYLELSSVNKIVNGQAEAAIAPLIESKELLTNKANKDKRLCMVYLYLSYCYNFTAANDSAIFYMNKSLTESKAIKDSIRIVDALSGLGNLYGSAGQFDKAISKSLEAIKISEIHPKLKNQKYTLYLTIANLYMRSEVYEPAEKILAESIPELTNSSIPFKEKAKDLWAMNLTMAKLKGKLKKPKEGLVYVDSAYSYAHTLNEYRVSITDLHKVRLNIQLDRFELGYKQLVALHNKIQKSGHENLQQSTFNLFYELYSNPNININVNLLKELKPLIEKVSEKNKGQFNLDLFDAQRLSTMISIFENNENKAISSYATVLEIKDSLLNKEKVKISNELIVKYETEQKDKKLALQALQIAERKSQNAYLLAFALGLLLIASILFLYYNQKRKYANKLEEEVNKRTEELRNTNASLKQSNEELARYTYIASHDLKEPLRNIGSFVSLIKRKDLLKGEEGKNYFDFIQNSTTQMNRIVDDILEYSELRNHEGTIEDVKPTKILQDLEKESITSLGYKNFKINSYDFPENIQSDKKLIKLLFKCLIENGLKYNTSLEPTVNINYTETENNHQFQFSDNGIGIEKEYFETIFIMFKRLHNREIYQGSGIGLAMSKRITDYFKGKISVESELGKGSQFIVRLPK